LRFEFFDQPLQLGQLRFSVARRAGPPYRASAPHPSVERWSRGRSGMGKSDQTELPAWPGSGLAEVWSQPEAGVRGALRRPCAPPARREQYDRV